MTDFGEFLAKLQQLPNEQLLPEPNFFSVGGSGYLENPTSDLLALFMGAERGVPRWLAKALVTCLAQRGHSNADLVDGTDWEKVTARREVAHWHGDADSPKRLDLLISDGNFVLGVEHKVYASAAHNPFDAYDALLQHEAATGLVLKCVLRVNQNSSDVPPTWPVISYKDLVDAALAQYGTEVALAPVSKWQFFYREFLLHLRGLAQPGDGMNTMSGESLNFAMENFAQLLKATDLLGKMEDALKAAGHSAIERSFSQHEIDSIVKTGVSNWRDNFKALRYFPKVWGGDSQVVLVYYPSTGKDGGKQLQFYVQAYIDRQTTKVPLEEIQRKFESDTGGKILSWMFASDDKHLTWYESNRRLLALSAWARVDTKDGALVALGDLAIWIHQNAFTA